MAKTIIDPKQARAVLAFRDAKGHQWKSRLRNYWLSAEVFKRGPADEETGALLRQVRNELGPRWLQTVTVEELKRAAYPALEDTKVACQIGADGINSGTLTAWPTPDGIRIDTGRRGAMEINHDQLPELVSILYLARELGYLKEKP